MPLLSAIILNYRTPQHAVRCVKALRAQTIADQIEIIVVDNHSEDDSIGVLRNRLKEMPSVRIVEAGTNGGFACGNNIGIRFALGKFLLILNPDNILTPDSVEKMVKAMEADSTIGLIAPKLIQEDGSVRRSMRSFPSMSDVVIKRTALRHLFPKKLGQYLQLEEDPDQMRDVDWVVGACMLIHTETYREIGGLDERFFLFFEDMDLCRRLWAAGKRVVYFPQAQAADRKRRLSEGGVLALILKPAGRAHVRSGVQYFWKWRGRSAEQPRVAG